MTPRARAFDRLPEQGEDVGLAPTVAWLLGLHTNASDFPGERGSDGRVLTEAFTQFQPDGEPPSICGLRPAY